MSREIPPSDRNTRSHKKVRYSESHISQDDAKLLQKNLDSLNRLAQTGTLTSGPALAPETLITVKKSIIRTINALLGRSGTQMDPELVAQARAAVNPESEA